MNPDGSEQRRLSRGEFPLENPAALWWLPGGREIAVWEMGTGGGTGISLVDVRSGAVTRPAQLYSILDAEGYLAPCVNSYLVNPVRGDLVACALYDLASSPGDLSKNGLFLVNLVEGTLVGIKPVQFPASYAWSADGNYLYFTDRSSEGRYCFFRAGSGGGGYERLGGLPEIPWDEDMACQGPYADFLFPH